ncbi:50S ribosomal protein L5 [Patescibacteria group bacterium]|nr:50S ribosomal protein L5 [Patescibacteria group bacterium]
MKYDLQKKYTEEVVPEMIKKFGYKNRMAVPKIQKVVVNSGIGSVKDKEQIGRVEKQIALIIGQKPLKALAKKSIASFKTRKGAHIGYSATLRKKRMYDFLNKMIFVALPRQRDFRGLDWKSVDAAGNLTIGFKDYLVFPEMAGEDLKNTFGFSVTVVTSAKNKEEMKNFLTMMGFPFKKE